MTWPSSRTASSSRRTASVSSGSSAGASASPSDANRAATLATVHLLKRDVDPSRTIISSYALGPYGWLMTLAFGGWAAASLFAVAALVPLAVSIAGRIGLSLLAIAGAGLAPAMSRWIPSDAARPALSGRMHGLAFLIGVPGLVTAPVIPSLTLQWQAPRADMLLSVTSAIWLGLALLIVAMLRVGPGPGPDPDIPRLLGWSNRPLMAADALWLNVAASPLAR